MCLFDTAPPKYVHHTWACPSSGAVSHKKFPLVSFFNIIRYSNTQKNTQNQFELPLNYTALLVALLQSVQSLHHSFSRKRTVIQAFTYTHRLNLTPVGALSSGITK